MRSDLHQFAIDTLKIREKQYIESPQLIIENYNHEQENIYSYNGRQLLEMLQNADDAAGKNGCEKKVLIALEDDILTIANHGHAFSKGGLESILYSNLSPKVMEQNMIGQKGLGFRSILSWAQEITISSGEVNLVFSRQNAISFLENVMYQNNSVKEFISTKIEEPYPIATLRVPAISEVHPPLSEIFDTVITIKLKEDIRDDVQKQIMTLVDSETLLFLNNLEEIVLKSPLRNEILKKKKESSGQIEITVNNEKKESKVTWNINCHRGAHMGKNYELKIAWTDDLRMHSGILHSYFKTAERFEFPGLAHGTFELSPDRNHLVTDPDGYNEFMLHRLAELMSSTAVKIVQRSTSKSSYEGLKILCLNKDILSNIFNQTKFSDFLLDAVKQVEVFPSVNGHYQTYTDYTVFYEEPIANYLIGTDVNHLLLHTKDTEIINLIRALGLRHFNSANFARIISNRIDSDAELLCILITTFLKSRNKSLQELKDDFSSLSPIFRDSNKMAIPWNKQIFLPTEFSDQPLYLPEEVEVSFMDRELADKMLEFHKIEDYNYLDSRLSPFKLHRFTFDAFSTILQKVYLSTPTSENVIKFHQNLYQIRKVQIARNEFLRKETKYANLQVINRKMDICKISDLYFGSDYAKPLTESLMGFEQGLFLASSEHFEIESISDLTNYFEWLGVNTLPQIKNIKIEVGHPDYREYKDYFLTEYNYNHLLKGTSYTNRHQAEAGIIEFYLMGIDNLDRILAYADHISIFSWIYGDHNLKRAIESSYDSYSHAMLVTKGSSSASVYPKMPNYIKWMFKSSSWLPLGKDCAAPENCCMSKKLGDLLTPLLAYPNIDSKSLKSLLEISDETIYSLLRLVGVHNDVGSLSTHQLYTMLSNLKDNDIEGKIAKSLYREILSNFEKAKLDTSSLAYKNFIINGQVWCTTAGKQAYKAISSTRYLDTKKYGNSITSEFNLISIDRKQGVEKVKEFFGVLPLNDLKFTIHGIPLVHTLDTKFKYEIKLFKGIVYGLMVEKDSSDQILRRLKKMEVSIVTELNGQYHSDIHNKEFSLEDFDFVIAGEDSTPVFYIKVPASETSLQDLRRNLNFAEIVAEIFSTIFRTDQDRSFIRELFSRNPQDREELFFHEVQIEGPNKLHRSRTLLNLDTDQRGNFWRAIFYTKSINLDKQDLTESNLKKLVTDHLEVQNNSLEFLIDEKSFLQTNSIKFLIAAYELITVNEIDLELFQSRFIELDFSPLFRKQINHFVVSSLSLFSFLLYENLQKSDDLSEKSKYFHLYNAYTNIHYNTDDGFLEDLNKSFHQKILVEFGILLNNHSVPDGWDVNKKYQENITDFETLNIDMSIQEDLLSLEKKSLILFKEYDQLVELLNQYETVEIVNNSNKKIGETVLSLQSYSEISDSMNKQYDYETLVIETVEQTSPYAFKIDGMTPNGTGRIISHDYDIKEQHAPEKIGFMAEHLVYQLLKLQYPDETVVWKSENGRRSGTNIVGNDGHGYDIEYTRNGKLNYVEVKCIVRPELGFIMTNNELDFAINHQTEYELITVENISQAIPAIRRYPDLFILDESETLFNNQKFSIQNDNYRLRFRRI